MDRLRCTSLIRILVDKTAKKFTPISSVSIPDRDSRYLQPFFNKLYGLQNWAGRRKRLTTVSEISIPNRDSQLPAVLLTYFITYGLLIGRLCNKQRFNGLPILLKVKSLWYYLENGWLQRLRTGTETRWTAFCLSDALVFSFLTKKSLLAKSQWRYHCMESYKQLEIFDLHLYTFEQPVLINVEEEQFEEVLQHSKYKQLELELFPQTFYKPVVLEILAA